MRKTVGVVAINEKGKETKLYASRSAVAIDGFSPEHVRKILRGERQTNNGFTFRQLNSKLTKKLVAKYGTQGSCTPQAAARL